MLTARILERLSPARFHAFSTSSAMSAISLSGLFERSVGAFSSARILLRPSTTSAFKLVPPMSTPTIAFLDFGIGAFDAELRRRQSIPPRPKRKLKCQPAPRDKTTGEGENIRRLRLAERSAAGEGLPAEKKQIK